MFKKFLYVISICTLLIFTTLPFSSSAEGLIINKGIVSVETVSANCGDTVVVAVKINENPGFSALSISVNYDSSILEFTRHLSGNVIDCDSRAHPQKNIIRIVGGLKGSGDRKGNGTIINLEFKIADNAPVGLSKLDITYKEGDFSTWDLDKVMPKIVSGGIKVNLSEKNCKHKSYTEWYVKVPSGCNEIGIEQRVCNDCKHLETRETDPIDHIFNDSYTIDKIATEKESGKLSLHCKNCTAVTNELSFSLKHAEKGNFKNVLNATVKNTDYLKQLLKEQYPDVPPVVSEPEQSGKPPVNSESEPDNSTESIPDIHNNDKPQTDTNTENNKNDELSISEKIEESFPQSKQILKYFKIFIIVLIIVMII